MIYKVIITVYLFLVAFSNNGISQDIAKGNAKKFPIINVENLSYKVIPAPNNTYGYEILNKGKVFIKQTNIPGMPGVNGFKTKRKAEDVAKLVISKMSQGGAQPTVTIDELKKVNAL